jgi:hypothetical protein
MKTSNLKLPHFLVITAFVLLVTFTSCSENKSKVILNHDVLSECNLAIQNAIVLDATNPPVGSRRYFYASVAAYQALQPFSNELLSLSGQLKDLKFEAIPDTSKGYCLDLVALAAYTSTAKALVWKEDSVVAFRNRKLEYYKSELSNQVYQNSLAWGDSVSSLIIKWAKKDSFNETRGVDLYLAKTDAHYWQPTPTEYMQALEPNWKKIRPTLIPSADHFRSSMPEPSIYKIQPISKSVDSEGNEFVKYKSLNPEFDQLMKEVYDVSKTLDSNKIRIARYWDDNPNSTFHYGHATIKVLKVSPVGHWLSMFSTVARNKKYSLFQSAEGMVRLSAAIFDGFIAAWDAKYHYEYVRPVNAIRMHLDSAWLPLIETPAFPEYPSAHSVISSAAATVLTHMFGEYEFTDSAEMEFGLGTRHFKNFRAASDEACLSRLYGGIHFREGIENGKFLGNAIGEHHIKTLKTRKN